MMERIAILTYPVKHRKTFDLLGILKANGYKDVIVYAVPFHYRKKSYPIYQHRPEMNYNVPATEEICLNYDYKYEEGGLDSFEVERDRIVLISGAGILPDVFVKSHTIINSHPGYIPNCRGLDAFKWAIVENQPIGVTTHLVGDYIDAGMVIERRIIPVYKNDSFHSLSYRVYENEVSMLVEAIRQVHSKDNMFISPEDYIVHKRMPKDIEINLMSSFEQYRRDHGIDEGVISI